MKQFYLKLIFCLFVILLFSSNTTAQNNKSVWSRVGEKESFTENLLFRKTQPVKESFYQLDIEALKTNLKNAPDREASGDSKVVASFPATNGDMELFRIMEASILHPILQKKYPNIRSYVGQSIKNPSTTIRFSITPQGLHGMLFLAGKGTHFMDPYTKNGNDYIVYEKRDLPTLNTKFECGVVDGISANKASGFDFEASRNADDGIMRNFRLALACTIEYASFHWMAAGLTMADTEADKKAAVLAAMVVTMTRVNGIYERDLSLTMTLVPNNENIIFIDTDNFSNSNDTNLIDESQTEIDAAIGFSNYDIGHTFGTGGGGLASLNSPCTTSKARGTTGLASPIGDAYDIDFVAHEMGHQFGAPHSFNGDQANCAGGNRTASNAYEPGSGSTIMAYAGICAPQNVQSNSDAYFHQKSLQMIWDNISVGASSPCAAKTVTGNAAPTVEAGASYHIPISTPYKLTGSSTDLDGTAAHTYTWEQYDLGPAGIPNETSAEGPLVRSFEGTTNPVRYIPRLQDVISNGGKSTIWEKLVSIGRDINFQLTVRDNDVRGGQTVTDNMTVTTVAGGGPFAVTSQTTNETWDIGTAQTITWDVAGTDGGTVNTPTVNILLSTDGGLTFPFTMASSVPNDGSHVIIVPIISSDTTTARVIVEGNNNIFYAVNPTNFSIQKSEFVLNVAISDIDICEPEDAIYNITYETFLGFTGTTEFTADNVPTGAIVTFSQTSASANGTAITATISGTANLAPGTYALIFKGTSGTIVRSAYITLNVFSTTLDSINLTSPANGGTDFIASQSSLKWGFNANAENYLVEIATDSGFTTIIESPTVSTNSFTPATLLDNTEYFWRITPSNNCGTGTASATFSFTTASINCSISNSIDTPLNIPDDNSTGITSVLTIGDADGALIKDINVTINVTHPWVGDLTMILTSPDGTDVTLISSRIDAGVNYTNTVFNDDATNTIAISSAPYTGSFKPEASLAIYNNLFSNGEWKLKIVDGGPADIGSLDSWSIEVCGALLPDRDNDGIRDNMDNCPYIANIDQADSDGDDIGDLCDTDNDNDGVSNSNDMCPNTPAGEMVDVTGCTIFTLPSNNFKVLATNETCRSSNNGSIAITALDTSFGYTAQLMGNGLSSSNNFTTAISFPNLEAGDYKVCVTIGTQPTFEQCFNVTITEPEDLSVLSRVDTTMNRVFLSLTGSNEYIISLNGEQINTSSPEITLELAKGKNDLIVKTDKDCQGIYRETINNVSSMLIYPNPILKGIEFLNINTGDSTLEKIDIQLYSLLGQLLRSKTYNLTNGSTSLNISNLSSGIYLIVINTQEERLNYKIIKK